MKVFVNSTLYNKVKFLTNFEGKVMVASEIHPSPQGCKQQVHTYALKTLYKYTAEAGIVLI